MKRAFENYVFLPFTCFLAIFWTFTYHRVPETKNRTFEEISALFRSQEYVSIESLNQTPCRKSVQSDIVYGTTTVTPVIEQQQQIPPQQLPQVVNSIPIITANLGDDESIVTSSDTIVMGQQPPAPPSLGHYSLGGVAAPTTNIYQQQVLAQPPPHAICPNAMAAMAAGIASNQVYQQWGTCPAGNAYGSHEYEL